MPETIEIEGGTVLTLSWEDGTTSTIAAAALRAACECAACLGPTGSGSWMGDAATVRITNASVVGAYGVNFAFAPDGHHTGIFPYDRLRRLGED